MSGIEEIGVPKREAWTDVGIEGVEAVMLGRDNNEVVPGASNREVRDPKWRRVNGTVGGAGEKFAEGGRIDGRRGESKFVSVCAVTGEIVVIGQDAREIGDSDNKRSGSGAVADARGRDGVNTGDGRGRVGDRHARIRLRNRECATGGAGAARAAGGPVDSVRVRGGSGYRQSLTNRDGAALGRYRPTDTDCGDGERQADRLGLNRTAGVSDGEC